MKKSNTIAICCLVGLLFVAGLASGAADSEMKKEDNPYLKFINSTLVTIYIRKKFLGYGDVLEYASEISDLFNEQGFDFEGIKEPL